MKEYQLKTKMKSYQWDELSEEQREVVAIAKEQIRHSYCPYSHFHVGAAAKLANGVVMRGANQENAAYPSGLCAERTALFAAGAQYPDQPVVRLAIACYTDGHFTKEPGSPCGACRQVLAETEQRGGSPIRYILYGTEGTMLIEGGTDSILPFCFGADSMK